MSEAHEFDLALKQVFADILDLNPDQVTPALSPDTCVTWDSMSHVKLVAAIEEHCSVSLTPEEQADMLTYELAAEIVRNRMMASNPKEL